MSGESVNDIELQIDENTANISSQNVNNETSLIETAIDVELFPNHDYNIEGGVNKSSGNVLSAINFMSENHVTIEMFNENDSDSSVVDSDIDSVNGATHNFNRHNQLVSGYSKSVCTPNDIVKPNIGMITLQNTPQAMIGDKTIYQGPVTIHQCVSEKDRNIEGKRSLSCYYIHSFYYYQYLHSFRFD